MNFYHEDPPGHEAHPPRPGTLLIHGMTGAPEEMQPLAELLFARGFDVTAPLLDGHDQTVEALRTIPAEVWLGNSRQGLVEAAARKPPALFCIGLSFGALLCLYLATRSPEKIKALVLLAPPVDLRSRGKEWGLQLFSYLPDSLLDRFGSVRKTDRPATLFQRKRRAYDSHSIGSLARAKWILRLIRPELKKITCPVLMVHDPDEHHLSDQSAVLLQKLLPNADITQRWFPGAEHELTIGPRADEVNTLIADYVTRYT